MSQEKKRHSQKNLNLALGIREPFNLAKGREEGGFLAKKDK